MRNLVANCAKFSYYVHMKIQEITNKAEWKQNEQSLGIEEFLQSWEWGVFKESVGISVVRLGFFEEHTCVGLVQGFVHKLPFGFSYIYIPRADVSKDMLPILKEYTRSKGCSFIRIEPLVELPGKHTHNRQPQNTLILNIKDPEETLLEHMHKKTRYNIRVAQKNDVVVKAEKDINVFWNLHTQTTSRDGFRGHEKYYYEQMLASDLCEQFTAYFKGIAVASNIYLRFNTRMTYLHGASSSEHRNVMAPYVVQWHAITYAQKKSCTSFDFWGIAPHKDGGVTSNGFSWNDDHTFSGITRFKVGFSGMRKDYPDAKEIVLQPFVYMLYSIVRTLLR